MSVRYGDRRIILNQDPLYDKFMEQRHKKSIRQYATATMTYPTARELRDIHRIRHIWKASDRYYKLAVQYYGDTQYWWIIAFFNLKPTEADLKVGDSINIPVPLESILRAYER
tara:strand:+ start:675 stop:1013 length:339 start_codon:yes stop_codon:yes gene_type:complete